MLQQNYAFYIINSPIFLVMNQNSQVTPSSVYLSKTRGSRWVEELMVKGKKYGL